MSRSAARLVCCAAAAALVCSATAVRSTAQAPQTAQPTQVQVFDSGQLTVPSQWKRVQVQSPIVEHEFTVTSKDDPQQTARVTMMAAGGSVEDNINRWKGQFTGGAADAQKVEKVEVAGTTVHLVDVSGTFSERMGGGPFAGGQLVQRPDYAMIGAIIVTPDKRQYFVKMTGPEEVVKENREAFAKMVKGISKER